MSSVPTFIRFEQDARAAIEKTGLNWTAVEDIFLCLRFGEPQASLLDGCPSASRIYQTRELQALHRSLFALKERSYRLPCPWTGQLLSSNVSFTCDAIEDRLLFLPLIYRFEAEGRSFWVVSCDLTGRIVHLFIPSLKLVVYELSLDRAKAVNESIEKHLARLEQRALEAAPTRPKVVAVIDMVTNYGHQMINHLSGVDLLDKAGMLGAVDEFWVCGTNFFGPFDEIFPELGGKTLLFATKAELLEHMLAEKVLAVRVGANRFYEKTRARILRYALSRYAYPRISDRFPIIAVTVRTGGRVCTNLDELIAATYAKLHQRFPSVGFIIDGWVFPETQMISQSNVATSLDQRFSARIREELAAAEHSFRRIPKTAIVRNLIGTSILDSIVGLLDADAYIAHVGTLQHKLAFFSPIKGIVHGPTAQLAHIDSGAFQAELGFGPIFPPASAVEDIPGPTSRGPSFFDYRIKNVETLVSELLPLI
jgi:hypothetical protein